MRDRKKNRGELEKGRRRLREEDGDGLRKMGKNEIGIQKFRDEGGTERKIMKGREGLRKIEENERQK